MVPACTLSARERHSPEVLVKETDQIRHMTFPLALLEQSTLGLLEVKSQAKSKMHVFASALVVPCVPWFCS